MKLLTGDCANDGELDVPNTFSSRPKSLRAALLGAAALAAVGAVSFEALPIASHPALAAAASATLAGPSSFADVVDRVKGAVVSVRVKLDEANASDNDPMQSMPNFPKGTPFERFFREFGERQFGGRNGPDQETPRHGMAQGSGFFISADGY